MGEGREPSSPRDRSPAGGGSRAGSTRRLPSGCRSEGTSGASGAWRAGLVVPRHRLPRVRRALDRLLVLGLVLEDARPVLVVAARVWPPTWRLDRLDRLADALRWRLRVARARGDEVPWPAVLAEHHRGRALGREPAVQGAVVLDRSAARAVDVETLAHLGLWKSSCSRCHVHQSLSFVVSSAPRISARVRADSLQMPVMVSTKSATSPCGRSPMPSGTLGPLMLAPSTARAARRGRHAGGP